MNAKIQEQRVVEVIRETCRKLDVKFSYTLGPTSDDGGILILPCYDRSWRKRRAQLAIAFVLACCTGSLLSATFFLIFAGGDIISVYANGFVSLAAIGVAHMVDRMRILPWAVIHWHIDGELRKAGFAVHRYSECEVQILWK